MKRVASRRRQLVRDPLHNWYELHVAAATLFEEPADLKWVLRIPLLNRSERMGLDAVPLQRLDAANDFIKCGLAAFVDTVGIVQPAWAID